jgi:hypothetical protein
MIFISTQKYISINRFSGPLIDTDSVDFVFGAILMVSGGGLSNQNIFN